MRWQGAHALEHAREALLELPAPLLKAIDVVYEEYRSPASHYCDKAVCMEAPWLGDDARHAKEPEVEQGAKGRAAPAAKKPVKKAKR